MKHVKKEHGHHRNFTNLFLHTFTQRYSYFIIVESILSILLGTFEIALLFRLTDSVTAILIMYAVMNVASFVTYFQIHSIVKLFDIDYFFKLGIILHIISSLFLLGFFPYLHSIFLLMVLAVIKGIQSGVFNLSQQFGRIAFIEEEKRDEVSLDLQAIQYALPIGIPVLAGYVVDNFTSTLIPVNDFVPQGYFALFFVSLCFNVCALIFAPRSSETRELNVIPEKVLKAIGHPDFKYIRRFIIYSEFKDNSLMFAGLLLTFFVLRSEFEIGFFTSFMSLVAVIYFEFVKNVKVRKKIKREFFILLGACSEFVARWFFVLNYNVYGLVVRSVLTTFMISLKTIIGNNYFENELEKAAEKHNFSKADMLLTSEFYGFIARLCSYFFIFLLMYWVKLGAEGTLILVFILFSLGGFIDFVLLKKITRNNRRKHNY